MLVNLPAPNGATATTSVEVQDTGLVAGSLQRQLQALPIFGAAASQAEVVTAADMAVVVTGANT